MGTKYTKMNTDAFKHLALNAGILVQSFDPEDGSITGLMGATTGGMTFAANPTYEDFGEDVDQAPNNLKELKRVVSYDPTMSGTFLEITPDVIKSLTGAADIDADDETHIIPRGELLDADFDDVWWVGDYSDVNTGANAGYLAIHLRNALNTTGFQITTAKNAKTQFAFEYHAHYSLSDTDDAPFEIYCKAGANETAGASGKQGET